MPLGTLCFVPLGFATKREIPEKEKNEKHVWNWLSNWKSKPYLNIACDSGKVESWTIFSSWKQRAIRRRRAVRRAQNMYILRDVIIIAQELLAQIICWAVKKAALSRMCICIHFVFDESRKLTQLPWVSRNTFWLAASSQWYDRGTIEIAPLTRLLARTNQMNESLFMVYTMQIVAQERGKINP